MAASTLPSENDTLTTEGVVDLEELLQSPASFAEIEASLPPALRYLGPRAWIDTIKNCE